MTMTKTKKKVQEKKRKTGYRRSLKIHPLRMMTACEYIKEYYDKHQQKDKLRIEVWKNPSPRR